MFRVALFFFLMLSASTAHAATTTVATSSPEAFRGTVERVTRCYPSGSAITLTNGTVVLTFGAPLFPLGATIEPGQTLYALTRATSTCDIEPSVTVNLVSGKVALAMAVSATSTGGTGGGGGNGGGGSGGSGSNNGSNPIQNQFSQLINSATSKLQSLLNPPQLAGPSAAPGVPFGGPIATLIPCNNGAIYVVLGPPTPGPYVWMPGTISYAYGPPSFVGQYLLGTAMPGAGVCVLGTSVLIGSRIIMHGSSGPVTTAPTPPRMPPSSSAPSCSTPAGAPNTMAAKLAAERSVRDQLSACNIEVTSSRTKGAPCALGQNGLTAGCTDVGGLSCDAIKGICEIARKCPLKIIGATELGHHTTGSGREIDVLMDPACMKKYFPSTGKACRYRDPVTGSTFLDETTCDTPRKTGPHIHICVTGKGC